MIIPAILSSRNVDGGVNSKTKRGWLDYDGAQKPLEVRLLRDLTAFHGASAEARLRKAHLEAKSNVLKKYNLIN